MLVAVRSAPLLIKGYGDLIYCILRLNARTTLNWTGLHMLQSEGVLVAVDRGDVGLNGYARGNRVSHIRLLAVILSEDLIFSDNLNSLGHVLVGEMLNISMGRLLNKEFTFLRCCCRLIRMLLLPLTSVPSLFM